MKYTIFCAACQGYKNIFAIFFEKALLPMQVDKKAILKKFYFQTLRAFTFLQGKNVNANKRFSTFTEGCGGQGKRVMSWGRPITLYREQSQIF